MASINLNSPVWLETQQNLAEVYDEDFKSFKIKKNEVGYLYQLFQQTVIDFGKQTSDELRACNLLNLWPHRLQYDNFLFNLSEVLSKNSNSSYIQTKFGIDLEKQNDINIEVFDYTMQLFYKLPTYIDSKKDIENYTQEIQKQLNKHSLLILIRLNKTKIIQAQFKSSQEDKLFLGFSHNEDIKNETNLDCACYALLRVREIKAIPWIRNGSAPAELYKGNHFNYFKEWGYKPISSKEVQSGDLVMYLDESINKKMEAKHFGIMTEKGLVESKTMTESCVCQHKLEDISGNFGDRVIFLRKNT